MVRSSSVGKPTLLKFTDESISRGEFNTVSSPSPIVLADRHPNAVQMLKEVFKMDERDLTVLKLCNDGPLSLWQCNPSRRRSAKYLQSLGRLRWVFQHQRWEITGSGRCVFNVILYYLSEYEPPVRGLAPVVEFPSNGKSAFVK
jgi:hypothetical protein